MYRSNYLEELYEFMGLMGFGVSDPGLGDMPPGVLDIFLFRHLRGMLSGILRPVTSRYGTTGPRPCCIPIATLSRKRCCFLLWTKTGIAWAPTTATRCDEKAPGRKCSPQDRQHDPDCPLCYGCWMLLVVFVVLLAVLQLQVCYQLCGLRADSAASEPSH